MANEPHQPKSETETAYSQCIDSKTSRKLKARSGEGDTIPSGINVIGVIGWSIVIPTLLGVAIGSWIDRNYHSGYSWTLIMLILGLIVGCLNAWFWMMQAAKKHQNQA